MFWCEWQCIKQGPIHQFYCPGYCSSWGEHICGENIFANRRVRTYSLGAFQRAGPLLRAWREMAGPGPVGPGTIILFVWFPHDIALHRTQCICAVLVLPRHQRKLRMRKKLTRQTGSVEELLFSPIRDNSKGNIIDTFSTNRVHELLCIVTKGISINIDGIFIWIGSPSTTYGA